MGWRSLCRIERPDTNEAESGRCANTGANAFVRDSRSAAAIAATVVIVVFFWAGGFVPSTFVPKRQSATDAVSVTTSPESFLRLETDTLWHGSTEHFVKVDRKLFHLVLVVISTPTRFVLVEPAFLFVTAAKRRLWPARTFRHDRW